MVDFEQYVRLQVDNLLEQMSEDQRAALIEMREEAQRLTSVASVQEVGFFWIALDTFKRGLPPASVYRLLFAKAGMQSRYQKAMLRARFKAFVDEQFAVSNDAVVKNFTRESLSKLFKLRQRRGRNDADKATSVALNEIVSSGVNIGRSRARRRRNGARAALGERGVVGVPFETAD